MPARLGLLQKGATVVVFELFGGQKAAIFKKMLSESVKLVTKSIDSY